MDNELKKGSIAVYGACGCVLNIWGYDLRYEPEVCKLHAQSEMVVAPFRVASISAHEEGDDEDIQIYETEAGEAGPPHMCS